MAHPSYPSTTYYPPAEYDGRHPSKKRRFELTWEAIPESVEGEPAFSFCFNNNKAAQSSPIILVDPTKMKSRRLLPSSPCPSSPASDSYGKIWTNFSLKFETHSALESGIEYGPTSLPPQPYRGNSPYKPKPRTQNIHTTAAGRVSHFIGIPYKQFSWPVIADPNCRSEDY